MAKGRTFSWENQPFSISREEALCAPPGDLTVQERDCEGISPCFSGGGTAPARCALDLILRFRIIPHPAALRKGKICAASSRHQPACTAGNKPGGHSAATAASRAAAAAPRSAVVFIAVCVVGRDGFYLLRETRPGPRDRGPNE